jgi:hypothetical protein
MKKAEKILEKHIVLNDCIGYLGRDGRLYKAIIHVVVRRFAIVELI